MNITPQIPLILGCIAAALFVAVFIISALITYRNRRIIQRYTKGNLNRGE